MEKSVRVKLHFMVTYKIGGSLFAAPEPVENLPLGTNYIAEITRLNKRRSELFDSIISDLSNLEPNDLTQRFSEDGTPISEEGKLWAENYRHDVDLSFRRLPIWYNSALFRTKNLADYEHWARSEFLTIDEVVWLSVGLEPSQQVIDMIEPYDRRGTKQKRDNVAVYMSRHKETIRRKFDPHGMSKNPDLEVLRDWIVSVDLKVHPGFTSMLENKLNLSSSPAHVSNLPESLKPMEDREKLSMSKLIAAMAIDGYGYDPKARRSDIPNEIQGIADRMGLEISGNTIRKYLKMGSELIPDDWEPQ